MPTCIIDLKARPSAHTTLSPMDAQVAGQPTSVNQVASDKSVTFEVTQDTLETVLDGLNKIRDQLASVAGAQ